LVDALELTGRRRDGDGYRNAVDDQAKIELALSQAFLGSLAVLDVGAYAVPPDDPSLRVTHRTGTDEKPAKVAVEAPHARLHLAGLARRQDRLPAIDKPRQIFGVDRALPTRAGGVREAEAGVGAPASVEEVDIPVGKRRPRQNRQRIEHAAELVRRSVLFGVALHGRRMHPARRECPLYFALRSASADGSDARRARTCAAALHLSLCRR
jgi:hypothetical protein